MDQPLIYKYKPKNLDNFNFETDFKFILNKFINNDLLNLLFVGDSGSCKTTLINIICKQYYGEDYDSNNVLIINSLKEQGISYYRTEVKTFCQTICSIPNKKKIILIDDLDLINENSQQVFRNCLDKYSNNVNLIASCQNLQKIIETYQSRVTILKINKFDRDFLMYKITDICNNENIVIDDESKKYLIDLSNNSIRTIINYLEKFRLLEKKINKSLIISNCTNISLKFFNDYTEICKKNNIFEALKKINYLIECGYSVIDILDNYFTYIKICDILEEEIKYKVTILICKYITKFYNLHEDEIELAFFTNNLINLLK